MPSKTPSAPDPEAATATARLRSNLEAVRERIAVAARACGREPSEVALLAITKSAPPELAEGLLRLGVRDLGENRLPAFDAKLGHFAGLDVTPPTWHFVGHIQRNKARRIVERSDVIHSIDSARLLEAVLRHAEETGRRPGLYLQVQAAPEDAKGGLDPDELPAVAARAAEAAAAGGPALLGLMAMAPLCPGADDATRRAAARQAFDRVAALAAASAVPLPGLSLGMTGDLEQAVAAGSTCVRVGSALFEGLVPPREVPGG